MNESNEIHRDIYVGMVAEEKWRSLVIMAKT